MEWQVVDSTLCIAAVVQNSNHEPISAFWSQTEGRPIFIATMARKRFTDIMQNMRFDNKETRHARLETDNFAQFRDIWTLFQEQLPKFYVPGTDICVVEQFVPFR